jgi:hypothetical protein
MNQSFYLTKFPQPQAQSLPNVVRISSGSVNKGASIGLWISIIFGTLLLGASFFLVWYYLLREKYIPAPPTQSPSQVVSEATVNEIQSMQNNQNQTVLRTLAPCPSGSFRDSDKTAIDTCDRCLFRQTFQDTGVNCGELSACKCKPFGNSQPAGVQSGTNPNPGSPLPSTTGSPTTSP